MKIGLVGFYGFNAYSDEFLAKAIQDEFNRHAEIKWQILPLGHGSYKDLDLVILGGGSLLGHPFSELQNYLKSSETPFVIFGTGVREFQDMGGLRYLWDRASLIAVRGAVSLERLDEAGFNTSKISVCGDPIFLFEDEQLDKNPVMGGVFRPHRNVDSAWLDHAFDTIQELRGEPPMLIQFSSAQGDKGFPFTLEEAYYGICKSSFWFGNRLHPFCIALINNIPAIAVEMEFRKVEDVCSTIEYPHWVKSGDNIIEVYGHLMQNWSHERKNLKYRIDGVRTGLKEMVQEILDATTN